MSTTQYDDAEVPLSAPLLKMAIKKNWVGKDSNITCPYLANSTDGISPFLVLDLTEYQVASINEDYEALNRASYFTLQDIKILKNIMTPEIPDTADGFMLILKRYANLNFALLSETRPLFRALVKVIDSIKAFSRVACDVINFNTKVSIIWIILLQIRKFSMGDTTILAEFSTMQTNLSSKKWIIIHVGVPIEILFTTQRKRTRYFDPVTDPIPKE